MNIYHPNLTQEKWQKYSKMQQILSVGAELGRAKSMIKNGDIPETKNCYLRAIELVDMIINSNKWKTGLKEILRFREMLGLGILNKSDSLPYCLSLYKALLSWHPDTYNLKI